MPIYEFKCNKCDNIVEFLAMTEFEKNINIVKCTKCDSMCEKIMPLSNFKLIGDTWSKDGYESKKYSVVDHPPK